METIRRAAVWVGCFVLALTPAGAATLWLEPDIVAPRANQPVQLRLMLGERFAGEERAIDGEAVVAFQRLRKNGRDNLPRDHATQPAASYTTGGAGVEIVTLTWQGKTGDYFCKSVQVVGAAEPGHPLRYSETGQRLEIVPQTDPVELAREGGTLEVQVLYEREPLAGVRLLALPRGAAADEHVIAITDEIGVAKFELTRPGLWLVELAYKHEGARLRSTLVLRAGPP
jgi:hypothetical protein